MRLGNRWGGGERERNPRERGDAGNGRAEETNRREPRDLNSFAMTGGPDAGDVVRVYGQMSRPRPVAGRICAGRSIQRKAGRPDYSLYLKKITMCMTASVKK
jgi:hypothetical protein